MSEGSGITRLSVKNDENSSYRLLMFRHLGPVVVLLASAAQLQANQGQSSSCMTRHNVMVRSRSSRQNQTWDFWRPAVAATAAAIGRAPVTNANAKQEVGRVSGDHISSRHLFQASISSSFWLFELSTIHG